MKKVCSLLLTSLLLPSITFSYSLSGLVEVPQIFIPNNSVVLVPGVPRRPLWITEDEKGKFLVCLEKGRPPEVQEITSGMFRYAQGNFQVICLNKQIIMLLSP